MFSKDFLVIAGPCCIENEEQALNIAFFLKNLGITVFKGGIYKPRTSPYSFQGLGREGIKILKTIRDHYNFIICSEIMDIREISYIHDVVDIIQVGTRNMQNFPLLKELGKLKKTILLKRGFSATIDEWVSSAEYIYSEGNKNVILCERGIRSFDQSYTRNILDLSSVLVIKEKFGIPVIVDPSHGSGNRDYVSSLTKASIAVGASGVLLDVHPFPDKAIVDGFQSLDFKVFEKLWMEMAHMIHWMKGNFF